MTSHPLGQIHGGTALLLVLLSPLIALSARRNINIARRGYPIGGGRFRWGQRATNFWSGIITGALSVVVFILGLVGLLT